MNCFIICVFLRRISSFDPKSGTVIICAFHSCWAPAVKSNRKIEIVTLFLLFVSETISLCDRLRLATCCSPNALTHNRRVRDGDRSVLWSNVLWLHSLKAQWESQRVVRFKPTASGDVKLFFLPFFKKFNVAACSLGGALFCLKADDGSRSVWHLLRILSLRFTVKWKSCF